MYGGHTKVQTAGNKTGRWSPFNGTGEVSDERDVLALENKHPS